MAADREHLEFFLFGRALHPQVVRHPADSLVDEIQTADLRHVARAHLLREAEACRTVRAEIPAHGPVAEFGLPYPDQGLTLLLVFVLEDDHVRAARFDLGNVMRV